MINLYNFFTFFLSILPSIISQNPNNCDRSCPGGQFNLVPYPFGFSSGCQIELNCTSYGTALIGEFPIQQITPDELLVTRPTKCGRTVDSISHLYGKHYALTSTNNIFMETCKEKKNNCRMPKMKVGTQLESVNCSGVHDGYDGNVSCYTGNITRMFLEYENVTRMGCRFLVPVAESETIGDSEAVSMDMQVFKLGWWVKGTCNCSDNANCTSIVSPVDGSDGHRCKCESGFDGDGYKASSGCRNLTGDGGKSLARNEGEIEMKVGIAGSEVFHWRKLIQGQGSKGAFNTKWKLVIGFSCGITGIMFLLLFVILGRKKRLLESQKASNHQIEIFIRNHGSMTPKRFKYSEIKKMTNSFIAKLGKGGFGSVFKGQLHNGNLVAVKLLDGAMGDGEDFINEVASISKTSHVNIVTLLGFCFEGNKRALIYEFMPNGSLDKFLRGNGSRLDWNTLFRIAKGIARGLEYLHQGCNTRIVHFDIKPHNVLLDEEFVPKISDFGLAKLCKKKESIVSIMGARGTAGYMAPEVFFKSLGGASHKSDVYSYGMMVLEMSGARKNSNTCVTSTSEVHFLDWIYKQVEGGDNLGVDGVTSKEEEELARKMVMVSLWCIQSDPSDRPSISKVVEMLEGSLESLQVPPRGLWSSPTSVVERIPPLPTQSSAKS